MKTIFFLFLLFPNLLFSQKQERQIFVYNVAFGSLSSGIGAVINKPKNSDWKKYFQKGAWQGSIGGLLNYGGKKAIYLINKKNEPGYGWPAKILHSAGTSIIENAALGEPFLQNWNIDVGIVRLDFSTNSSRPFKARFLPMSLYGIIEGSKRGKFHLNYSLRTGSLIYYSIFPIQQNLVEYSGSSYGRSLIFTDYVQEDKYRIISHELVHIFQYRDYLILNSYFKSLEKKVTSKFMNKLFSQYIYADIPYFSPVYLMEGKRALGDHYYKNFFEFEAERMATNRYVPR